MRLRVTLLSIIASAAVGAAAEAENRKPSVPAGRDPGGVAIALIGTGIDYTIPEVARRLARDGEGEIIGWDIEDKDRRPFDKSRGETRPEWGGDGTALIRLVGLTGRRVVPVRINPADPISIARAVAFVAQTPARIVVVPMWSWEPAAWEPFRQAAARFADLLFVIAAGDDAGVANQDSVWPAAFRLPNGLVVAATPRQPFDGGRPQGQDRRAVEAYANLDVFTESAVTDTSRAAAVKVADAIAGCLPRLAISFKGETLKSAVLAQIAKVAPKLARPVIQPCAESTDRRP